MEHSNKDEFKVLNPDLEQVVLDLDQMLLDVEQQKTLDTQITLLEYLFLVLEEMLNTATDLMQNQRVWLVCLVMCLMVGLGLGLVVSLVVSLVVCLTVYPVVGLGLVVKRMNQQPPVEIQESHILKGRLVNRLPEDWRADLEALRHHLVTRKKQPKFLVNLITIIHLLDMLKAHIQIKLENISLFSKNKNKEVCSPKLLTGGDLKTNNHRATVSFFDFKS